MKRKKYSTAQAGCMVILFGPIFAILGNLWIDFMGIDKNMPVAVMSDIQLWGYILMLGLLSGVSGLISMGIVIFFIFLYKKFTGKKDEPDYF